MGSFKIMLLAVIMCIGIATNASARVQSQTHKNLPDQQKSLKNNNNKFETLTKIKESSENKKRTLLGDNLMKVPGEDDEDNFEEGSGDTKKIKDPSDWKDDDDDYYYDDEDYEEDDDEDVYDDEVCILYRI